MKSNKRKRIATKKRMATDPVYAMRRIMRGLSKRYIRKDLQPKFMEDAMAAAQNIYSRGLTAGYENGYANAPNYW